MTDNNLGVIDDKVGIYVGGAPVSNANPLPTTAVGGGSSAVTVADGADVTQGALADAAIDTDAAGSVSGKLRGLVKLLVNLLSRWPAALGAGGGLKVDGSGTALPVSGTVTASGPLTDVQLRATPVPVDVSDTTFASTVADGADVALGATTDADTALTVIGRLKKLVSILAGGLPAALGTGGGLKVDGSGTALPVSGTVTATSTVADGADVALGALADAAIDTDTTGSVSGKLRGLVKLMVNLLSRWPAALGAGGGLKVDGSGTALPVSGAVTTSGTVTEANSAAIAASLSVMDDWDETDRAKVNTIAGQVGVQGGSGVVTALTQRTVLATDVALPTGTNAIGKLAANDGVDIGDTTNNNVATAPVIASAVSSKIYDSAGTLCTVKTANGVATASGDNVVLAAVTSKKIRVLSYALQVQESGTVVQARFQDNATTTNRTMPWWLFASADGTSQQGVVRNPGGDGQFYFETAAGVGLDLNLSSATDVGWEITYIEAA